MLKSFLLENYGYNEPIFLNDLKIEELSENAVRQSVKRLVANGFLERFDKGIYYIPKQDGVLGKSYREPVLVIMRKHVRNESETYGYVTGMTFANQLGLTTQMPAIIEYILDAKYYKYGVSGKAWDLPESTSINKQITYGEYVANEEKFKKRHGANMKVYNAFLMPFDSLKSKCSDNPEMIKVGEAVSNWKDNAEEYQKIQGILVDVKTLMNINIRQEMKEIEKLAELIES